jgi:hypothetical protein
MGNTCYNARNTKKHKGTGKGVAPMIRNAALNVRLNANERQLAEAVAERLERTESDMVRLLLRREAERLGIMPAYQKRQPIEAAGVHT